MKQLTQVNQKPNLFFESYKLFYDGKEEDLSKVPSSLLYPLLQWFSFGKSNIEICSLVNKYFMYVRPEMIKWILFYKIDIDNRFIKRMKSIQEDSKMVFLKDYIKQYFKWSEREYLYTKPVIEKLLLTDVFKQELSEVFGFSEVECKKLGIKYTTAKRKHVDTGTVSLFSFAKK
jgi:hypothetical protein